MSVDIRDGLCPSCGHEEIIESLAFEHGDRAYEALAVTHERVDFFGASGFDPTRPYGRLRMYVCRRCGLTQWYADHPQDIPIGDAYLTRLLKRPPGQGGPYR